MYAVFKFDEQNMYRAQDAIKIYQRKSAAEKYADKLNAEDAEAYKFRGYVVRNVVAAKRQDWFDTVNRVCGHWDRRGSRNELVLWFDGYKTSEMYDAEAELRKHGGVVMSADFDKICGKTAVVVREPRLVD